MNRWSGMRPKGQSHASMTLIVLIMVGFFAFLYVAGRLWQDAETRAYLVGALHKCEGKAPAISVDDTLKVYDCKEQKKKYAALQMELAAAKSQGFSSKRLRGQNATAGGRSLLAVIGIYTGFGQQARRNSIRNSWMASALRTLEDDKGILIRFVIGRSANRGDSLDREIDKENNRTQDFFILKDHIEGPDELPRKAIDFFTAAVEAWDADFYLKADDDVYVNIDKLAEMLATHWEKPRVYIGCMKSGEVIADPKQKWYEPESWKFGDDKTSYMRHAEGRMYGLSRAVTQYVAINNPILQTYRHEDVTVGSWMLGLAVEHIDERRLCCSQSQNGAICAGA